VAERARPSGGAGGRSSSRWHWHKARNFSARFSKERSTEGEEELAKEKEVETQAVMQKDRDKEFLKAPVKGIQARGKKQKEEAQSAAAVGSLLLRFCSIFAVLARLCAYKSGCISAGWADAPVGAARCRLV